MSKKICVCGKEHGTEPIIITITTCKNKHSRSKEAKADVKNLPSPSIAPRLTPGQSSARSLTEKEKNEPDETNLKKQQNLLSSEKNVKEVTADPSTSIRKLSEKEKINEMVGEDLRKQQNSSPQKTSKNDTDHSPSSVDTSLDKTNNEINNESIEGMLNSSKQNSNDLINQITSEDKDADEPSTDNLNNHKERGGRENDKDVYYMTETAVNTLPILESMFWENYKPNHIPNFTDDESNVDKCVTGIYILEKHLIGCKKQLSDKKKACPMFDGGQRLELVGKISFSICCEEPKPSLAKDNATTLLNISRWPRGMCAPTLKLIEEYVKNQKSSKPFQGTFENYVAVLDEKYQYSKMEKPLEIEPPIKVPQMARTISKKWYTIFLTCLGLSEEFEDEPFIRRNVSTQACEISKYLKI